MTGHAPAALPWWQLTTPTVEGAYTLDCHYPDRHRAARVPATTGVVCDVCGHYLAAFGWATLDRSRVLCGRCHHDEHAASLRAARELAAVEAAGELAGQLTFDDELA